MPTTQPRKNRAGWLSLGWLTDAALARDLRAYRDILVPVRPMSAVLKEVIRAGLDTLQKRR